MSLQLLSILEKDVGNMEGESFVEEDKLSYIHIHTSQNRDLI